MQSQIDIVKSKFFASFFPRFFLFVTTFVVATMSVKDMQLLGLYFFVFLFPTGLIAVLLQNFTAIPEWANPLGWLIYISISIIAIRTKNRRLFVFLYVVFVILLIANVAGCNLLVPNAINKPNGF